MNTNAQPSTNVTNDYWGELVAQMEETKSGQELERYLTLEQGKIEMAAELLAPPYADDAGMGGLLDEDPYESLTTLTAGPWMDSMATHSSNGCATWRMGDGNHDGEVGMELNTSASWAGSASLDNMADTIPAVNTRNNNDESVPWSMATQVPAAGPSQAEDAAAEASLPEVSTSRLDVVQRKLTEHQLRVPSPRGDGSSQIPERSEKPQVEADVQQTNEAGEQASETENNPVTWANDSTDDQPGDTDTDVPMADDCGSPSWVSAGTLDDTTLVGDDSSTPGPSTLGRPEGPGSTATAQATFEVVEAMSWTDKIAEFRRLAAMDDASLVAMKAYGNSTPVLQRATRMQLFQLALNAGWTKQVEKPTERGELKAHHLEALRAEVEADAHELEARMLPGTPAGDALPIIKAIRGLLTAWYHAHIAEVHEDDLWIFGKQAARPGNEELAKLREAAAASQQQDAGDARNPSQAKTTTKATTKGKGKARPQAQAKSRSTRNHPYQRPDRA
ncbi:hypothetical protein AURDEDRAFT_154413 [Auricularia subglabra TFB-10046 SS5]|uniref:Uncharacterized protein n=1 Tax=Auricularia subglabra (strain TFB-10046 / SS5) TaxID=717982 RepID=J0CZN9_AURST|nr:hypothetical protein AURDEDRAFT_154413 [Auricularia subglabra TFB-10046 SS5]